MTGHQGPVFSLKWNTKGDLLVTSSVDHTAIVWDTGNGQLIQQFKFHIREWHGCLASHPIVLPRSHAAVRVG